MPNLHPDFAWQSTIACDPCAAAGRHMWRRLLWPCSWHETYTWCSGKVMICRYNRYLRLLIVTIAGVLFSKSIPRFWIFEVVSKHHPSHWLHRPGDFGWSPKVSARPTSFSRFSQWSRRTKSRSENMWECVVDLKRFKSFNDIIFRAEWQLVATYTPWN